MIGAHDHASATVDPGWWASPYFYVPMFFVLAGIVLKEVFGAPLGPAKSLVDSLEVMANHAGGVLGLLMVMSHAGRSLGPDAAELARRAYELAVPSAQAAAVGGSTPLDLGILGSAIAAIAAGATYTAVWVTGHTFTVLVFLNPFSFLDPVLKLVRVAALVLLAALVAWAPSVAIVVSAIYVAFAFLTFGYFVRFALFGSIMAFDFAFRRGKGDPGGADGLACFANAIEGVPRRTYGRVVHDGQRLVFSYRPMFVRRTRHVEVRAATGLRSGALYATVVRGGHATVDLLTLSPRYQTHGDRVALRLGLRERTESVMLRGVRGAWQAVRGWFIRPTPSPT